jgi:hypothetical protein
MMQISPPSGVSSTWHALSVMEATSSPDAPARGVRLFRRATATRPIPSPAAKHPSAPTGPLIFALSGLTDPSDLRYRRLRDNITRWLRGDRHPCRLTLRWYDSPMSYAELLTALQSLRAARAQIPAQRRVHAHAEVWLAEQGESINVLHLTHHLAQRARQNYWHAAEWRAYWQTRNALTSEHGAWCGERFAIAARRFCAVLYLRWRRAGAQRQEAW